MTEDTLQRFLANRLFDVGGDDARLGYLREAADELAASLKASPARVSAFTMVAIDPEISPDEPILAEVGAILQKKWNSYKGAFSDPILPVVSRAIILTALEKIIGSEPSAAAVTLTARNLLPHVGAPADAELWKSLVTSAAHKVELRARRDWALPSTASFQNAEFELPAGTAIAGVTANKDWLIKQFQIALGPHDQDGSATNGNPHWPTDPQNWSGEFARRAAGAIAQVIDSVIKKYSENIAAAQNLEAQGRAIEAYVGTVASGVGQMSLGLERRNSLIWWKEALYSPSSERSYRTVSVPVAVVLMAIDASKMTGPFAPLMAESFLLETVRALDREETASQHQLTALCAQTVTGEGSDLVLQHLSGLHRESGRTTLASLIGSGESIDGAMLQRRIGLAADIVFTPAQFALWLFRELQASAASVSAVKRKQK